MDHVVPLGTVQRVDNHSRYNICCSEGAVKLPPIQDPPGCGPCTSRIPTVQFRDNICRYNSALAFTSINFRADDRLAGGFRPFQIQGELYHLQGPLENEPGVAPSFAQI
ncbi:hypothetical protein V8E54_008994 [Elaphomyces granulatus]